MMALFCVATVCAQEPNLEQLFRDAQQAQQSGNKRTSHFKNISLELATLYYRLHRSEDGAREKQIVERISEQERPNKTKAKVISRVLPSP
jgi:hypothetical protein